MRAGFLVLPLFASTLAAQGSIRGVVTDSLLGRGPLAGATVLIDGTSRLVTTDRRGRFELRDVEPGRHRLGFFHPRLDSLEIGAPTQHVEVFANHQARVTLATPSPNTVSLLLCRRPAAPSTTVLFGSVRASEDGAPLAGADVMVRWFEIVIARGAARQSELVARDTADSTGRYLLCGVPNDIALTLVAMHEGQGTGPLHLALDSIGVARLDLRVSRTDPAGRVRADLAPDDTSAVGREEGLARLTVQVRNPSGSPVRNAIVGVRGGAMSARTDDSGRAALRGVAAGSQTVVVRAVGRQPRMVLAEFSPGEDTRLEVSLDRFVTILPTVAVVRQRGPSAIPQSMQRRLDAGGGRLITGEQLKMLTISTHRWATIPGMSLGTGRDPLPVMRSNAGDRCKPTFWIDGLRMSGIDSGWDLEGLLLNAKRVEVYTWGPTVPPEFQSFEMFPCGAVIIWTR